MEWPVLKSYFADPLSRIVKHHIESYNVWTSTQLAETVTNANPIVVHSEQFYNKDLHMYSLEMQFQFSNLGINRPQIHETTGATKIMFPREARLRNYTYSSNLTVDIDIEYTVRTGSDLETVERIKTTLPQINIGKIPVMVRSQLCVLTQHPHLSPEDTGECRFDPGGYFIINGSEKTVIIQERAAENKIYCYPATGTSKALFQAEIKSVPDNKRVSPKQVILQLVKQPTCRTVSVVLPRLRKGIPLFIVFRAMGVLSDKDICRTISTDEAIWPELLGSMTEASKCYTEEEALQYIAANAMYPQTKSDKQLPQHRRKYAVDLLESDLLSHCRTKDQRVALLGYMTLKLLRCGLGLDKCDDRDSYENKRVDLTGTMMNNLFRIHFHKMTKDMQKAIIREMNTGSWRSTNDPRQILNSTNIYKIVKNTVERGLKSSLSTGDFSVKQSSMTRPGVAQVLSRLNMAATWSHLRRVNTPVDRNGKLVPPRRLHGSQFGFNCPAETPEGQAVGLVKNMSYMVHITIPSCSESLYTFSEPFLVPHGRAKTKVFINGSWVGDTETPQALYDCMKAKKYASMINIYTSVVFDRVANEVRVCNDAGRFVRPLFRVVDGRCGDPTGRTFDQCLLTQGGVESIIEYIDPDEQNNCLIALDNKHLASGQHFTHREIHPSVIFGVLASCIPFPEHNQSPRNTYQCAMGKQAVGVYMSNYHVRMDKSALVLTYPHRPLVDTRVMAMMRMTELPSGATVVVAIMSHTGYNQEDSVIVNQGALDRGLFMTTAYNTEKDEDKKVHGLVEVRCKPDPAKTKGMKFGNYEKLGPNGLVPPNTLLENRDIVIGKVIGIKGARNDPTQTIKHEDSSCMYRTDEETFMDHNEPGVNGDGYPFVKWRVRKLRKPQIGDKVSSRHGQKGTIGNVVPEKDMPFMANGMKPDLIINPHCIPSRMTLGQTKEMLLGKVLVALGLFGDGTAFTDLSVEEISRQLLALGHERHGEELMYNGLTGEQFQTSVFVGPCFYQRLKHMVVDKEHSRSHGPMTSLTRQPTEGRARDGGLRIGEMERDCLISHGATSVTQDRMLNASDKYTIHTCTKCGYIAAYNDQAGIHVCKNCGNTTSFALVKLPYACKLLFQELTTMCIMPRIITSKSMEATRP